MFSTRRGVSRDLLAEHLQTKKLKNEIIVPTCLKIDYIVGVAFKNFN
jgi:predicted GNAT family acetyltransferase